MLKVFKDCQSNYFVLITIFMVVAFIFRYQFILDQSYWMDELYSASRSLPDKAFSDVYYWGPDPHPPLHYIFLWITYKLFGFSEIAGRALSIFAGIISIPAVFFLGKEIFNKRTGLLAACAVTFNPVLFIFSLEARAYEFLSLFTILSSYLFIRSILNSKFSTYILYFMSLSILINLHFFGFLILSAHLLCCILIYLKTNNLISIKFIVLSIFLSSLSYIPLIGLSLEIAGRGPTWIQAESAFNFIQNTLVYFIFGSLFSINLINTMVGNILLIFLTLFFIYTFKRKFNFRYLLILCNFIFIFIFSYIIGLTLNPIFNARNAISFLPFLILILCFGIDRLIHNFNQKLAALFFLLIFILPFLFYELPQKQDWRRSLNTASQMSDKIYVTSWAGQWDVYKQWLELENIELLSFSEIDISKVSLNEEIYLVWAYQEPDEFESSPDSLKSLALKDKIRFNSSGINIYHKIDQ